jgi:hypothetical protein
MKLIPTLLIIFVTCSSQPLNGKSGKAGHCSETLHKKYFIKTYELYNATVLLTFFFYFQDHKMVEKCNKVLLANI